MAQATNSTVALSVSVVEEKLIIHGPSSLSYEMTHTITASEIGVTNLEEFVLFLTEPEHITCVFYWEISLPLHSGRQLIDA